MMNGKLMQEATGHLAGQLLLLTSLDDAGRLRLVYARAYGRPPSETEQQACLKYLQKAETPEKGLQGVMWSLLNTREFLLQH